MRIQPNETIITGAWNVLDGRAVADEAARRIEELVHSYLRFIGTDESGWDRLYQDPADKRYWELSYPEGHLHGGGPPQLRVIVASEARQKYGYIEEG